MFQDSVFAYFKQEREIFMQLCDIFAVSISNIDTLAQVFYCIWSLYLPAIVDIPNAIPIFNSIYSPCKIFKHNYYILTALYF